ncbi:MAG TPA: hypothetical protein VE441_05225 [Mycobacterium sp.]|jgi:hypothetical protein|nr:hypothetical protein [Mycobacterium sp.]
MERVIAHTKDGATLASVVTLVDGEIRRRYRIFGGQHDTAKFATLGTYATVQGIQFTATS